MLVQLSTQNAPSALSKMLPAFCFKWSALFSVNQRDCCSARALGKNASDFGDGNALDLCGDFALGWRSEEQLVIIAAMECFIEHDSRCKGKAACVNLSRDFRFCAETREIGREAVAQIHCSTRQLA